MLQKGQFILKRHAASETMNPVGRVLIGAGCVMICLGAAVILLERFHVPPGRLPGDIVIRSRGLTVYFPVVTCILLSTAATLLLWLLNRR